MSMKSRLKLKNYRTLATLKVLRQRSILLQLKKRKELTVVGREGDDAGWKTKVHPHILYSQPETSLKKEVWSITNSLRKLTHHRTPWHHQRHSCRLQVSLHWVKLNNMYTNRNSAAYLAQLEPMMLYGGGPLPEYHGCVPEWCHWCGCLLEYMWG